MARITEKFTQRGIALFSICAALHCPGLAQSVDLKPEQNETLNVTNSVSTNPSTTSVATNRLAVTMDVEERSRTRRKAGLMATTGLIVLSVLLLACGLALVSAFKQR